MYYFDNAATSYPKPEKVYSYTDTFYRQFGVNVGRGQYQESSISSNIVRETRDLLLELFHCNNSKEVVFTPSSTMAMNKIILGQNWIKGDIVYNSRFEHNAVLRTLHSLQQKYNLQIKYIEPDKNTLDYDFNQIKTVLSIDKPKLLIFNHVSNSFGFISPIQELCVIAKNLNIKTVIDMSQSAGLIDTNLMFTTADYAIFAGHKTLYAPFGIAGFIINKTDNLNPVLFGGTGIDSANNEMPKELPERFEPGSLNILAIAGLNASLKWIKDISIKSILENEFKTKNVLIDLLKSYSNIKLFLHSDINQQVGIISAVFDGYASDNIGHVLSNHNIAVRTGLHCAPDSHQFMGTAPSGTVRFSIGYFTNQNDIDNLHKALDFIEENS